MENNPVIVEETFDASVKDVWKAITDKDEMIKWYFDLEEFNPEPGFEFRFTGHGKKGESYTHICKVTEAVPESKLQYSWSYENFPGNSLVTFKLSESGNQVKVRLTHEGLESFTNDNPDFARENFTEGWNEIIRKSLKTYLNSLK